VLIILKESSDIYHSQMETGIIILYPKLRHYVIGVLNVLNPPYSSQNVNYGYIIIKFVRRDVNSVFNLHWK